MKRWAIIALAASAMALLLVVLSFAGSPSKGQAQPLQPNYKCYSITGPAVNIPVSVTTQFGTEPTVVVGIPSFLCLPVSVNGGGIPTPTPPTLKCYNIPGQDAKKMVGLNTRFGPEPMVGVRQALELCTPAGMAIVPDPAPPPEATPHYECYTITGSAPGATVNLETQFGVENPVAVGQPVRLCLPAGKNSPEIPSVPHLKCYNIDNPPPAKTVNLLTQFGPEANVVVGPATRLCVAADKVVIGNLTVGGIAEGPGLSGTSAGELGASDGGSGWSAGSYAALAAGLAAAAVALSAGAWYARRRWVR